MGDVMGALVLVATPIGNLGDVTQRAREVLATCDVVCCEDTRRTRALLTALSIPAGRRLVGVHAHNEAQKATWVAARIAEGATVAYVTDAGTPGVSDPGSRLVAEVVATGQRVTVLPGPSAALAALLVSGLPTERFCVEGFLPRKGSERTERLAVLAVEERTTVLFEAPSRLGATLRDLAGALGERPAAICRELTKLHEEVRRGSLAELADAVAAGEPPRGEVVVVIGGAIARRAGDDEVARAVAAELEGGATVRDTASAVATTLGVSRRRAYEAALKQSPGARE
jgi:16S rRNA (cytidine1402-2'-O)-methyltransferase